MPSASLSNRSYLTGAIAGAIVVAGALASCAMAKPAGVHHSERYAFRLVTVVEGLEPPWGMVFLPGGEILVTERPGRLRVIRDGVLVAPGHVDAVG